MSSKKDISIKSDLEPLGDAAKRLGYSYSHLRRLGLRNEIKVEKINGRLLVNYAEVLRAVKERKKFISQRDGRKMPDGYITAHEVARQSGYNAAHVNKMAQTGDIKCVPVGGRNYFDKGVVDVLAKRKSAMRKRRSKRTPASTTKRSGVGIGNNPASQFVIKSQSSPHPTSSAAPTSRPPSGDSSMSKDSWRVVRPPAVPIPEGSRWN